MIEKANLFVDVLRRQGLKAVNLVSVTRALEADIVCMQPNPRRRHLDLGVLTKFTAAFGFGEEIGALAAWQSGKELDMVKENDEKSQYIAIVSHSILLVK